MLNFNQFFQACSGFWQIERTYHDLQTGEIERSYTEYQVDSLGVPEKKSLLSLSPLRTVAADIDSCLQEPSLDPVTGANHLGCPGFGINFDTVSEKGERVSMNLKALFIPYEFVKNYETFMPSEIFPIAADLPATTEAIRGFYLRDEGYSESGLIQSSFTYLPSRPPMELREPTGFHPLANPAGPPDAARHVGAAGHARGAGRMGRARPATGPWPRLAGAVPSTRGRPPGGAVPAPGRPGPVGLCLRLADVGPGHPLC